MPTLTCPQLRKILQLDPNLSLMQNLLAQGIPVASSCKGDGICGKCRMQVATPGVLEKPSELEKKTLELNHAEPGERLSCQLHLKENAEVKTSYW